LDIKSKKRVNAKKKRKEGRVSEKNLSLATPVDEHSGGGFLGRTPLVGTNYVWTGKGKKDKPCK